MRITAYSFGVVCLSWTLSLAQPSRWDARGIGSGGAVFGPSINPSDPREMYIDCDETGLYHTTDAGRSWLLLDYQQAQSFHHPVQFATNPTVRYNAEPSGANTYRITKSDDGGATWVSLFNSVNPLYTFIADGAHGNRLLMASDQRLYFSTDGGTTFATKYTHTTNQFVLGGALFHGDSIYAGTSAGLLVSTDGGATFVVANIGGIPAGESIIGFAGASQGAVIRFYCVTIASSVAKPGLTGAAASSYRSVYKLDLGQTQWTSIASAFNAIDKLFFIATAPGDTANVYASGTGKVLQSMTQCVYHSGDGGATWKSVFIKSEAVSPIDTTNAFTNANIITGWNAAESGASAVNYWFGSGYSTGLAVAPGDAKTVVICNTSVPHISTDAGATWRQMYVDSTDENPKGTLAPKGKHYHTNGLETTVGWSLAWNSPSVMVAGFDDVLAPRSTDGGNSWARDDVSGLDSPTGGGHSIACSCVTNDSRTGIMYAGTSSLSAIYTSLDLQDATIDHATGAVSFSTDAGKTWGTLHNFKHPVVWVSLDSLHPHRLYASVMNSGSVDTTMPGGIYVSDDIQNGASSAWRKLADPPRTFGHPFNIVVLLDSTLVCTYGARQNTAGKFTDSSGVFVSTDGGAHWIDRSNAQMRQYVMDVTVDPHDATQNTWYVCTNSAYGGGSPGGFYKTTNRGVSWTKPTINGSNFISCAISPSNRDVMYIATFGNGLQYSSNLSSASPTFSRVATYPFANPTRIFFNPFDTTELWVISQGNALRVGRTAQATAAPTAPQLFAPPDGSAQLNTSPSLRWLRSSNTDWYRVQISTAADFSSFLLDTSHVTDTVVALRGLDSGVTYYWRVIALAASGGQAVSVRWSFTTSIRFPARPILRFPLDSAMSVALTDSVVWNPVAGADSYRLIVSDDSTFGAVSIDRSFTGTTHGFGLQGLRRGAEYYWYVVALNSAGSARSDAWRFTTATALALPFAPILSLPLDHSTVSATSAFLIWEPVVGAETYRFQFGADSSFVMNDFDDSGDVDTRVLVARLLDHTKYFWRVAAHNAAGEGPWSETWDFTTEPAAGVGEDGTLPSSAAVRISIAPNPTSGHAKVVVAGGGVGLVTLRDMFGRIVADLTHQVHDRGEAMIDVRSLAPGVYRCAVVVGGAVTARTIIVAR